jgi:HD superfamily phosphohydrolase
MYSHVYYHKTSRAADIQLLDMLKESKTVIEDLYDKKRFLQVSDDVMIYKVLHEEKNNRAKVLAEKYRRRELEYKMVYEEKIGLGLLLNLTREKIEGMKDGLENKSRHVGAKIDYYAVSPVRLDPERLVKWLNSTIILDKDGSLKTLEDIEPTLNEEVKNFGVVARIYIKREAARDLQLVDQVKEEFRKELGEFKKYLK